MNINSFSGPVQKIETKSDVKREVSKAEVANTTSNKKSDYADVESAKAKARADDQTKKVTEKVANEVAEQLTEAFSGKKLKFIVRNVNSTSSDNLEIQVINDKGDVIAKIPPEGIGALAFAVRAEKFTREDLGVLSDQTI